MGKAFQSLLNFSDDEPLSVGDVTRLVKQLIESDEQLKDVHVQGEISNLSRPASGHIYFTLKDGVAQIKCAMWKSQVARLRTMPRDGEAVVARGRVGVYEASGVYQLYVDALTPVGVGNLAQEFERLKLKLQAEGLFDASRKRALPGFPKRIGVVTSASAAAFQDILNVLRRRFPVGEVLLSPTLVQGDDAPPQIVNAIARLQGRCDVILIARGGGSIEELWAFNDERVVRAVAASETPTISGVGHEIDFTLTDFAADVRAPTPSAAAEMLTPDINDLRMRIDGYATLLDQQIAALIRDAQVLLTDAQRALRLLSPAARVAQFNDGLAASRERLDAALRARVAVTRAGLDALTSRLATLGPDATLARGYAIVARVDDGRIVRGPRDAASGDRLKVRTAAGDFGVTRD